MMVDNRTFILATERKPMLRALQVGKQDDIEVNAPQADQQVTIASGAISFVESQEAYSEKLYNLLTTVCLRYPSWNDFRILDFFNKRGLRMTMEELQDLRSQCGIESREDVCRELMELYFKNEIELGKKQIQFIERLNPAFRDRNFLADRPGDLLVYECIFFRRLNKMFYLHLVFDLFNGHAFGRVSRRCSGEIGLKLLQEKIIPCYRSRGYQVKTIVHSIKSTRDQWKKEEANIRDRVLDMGIQWIEPKHKFGIIQLFQRDWLNGFFSNAEALDVTLLMIQPAFDRWIIKYNLACPFHQRRNLLGNVDCLDNVDKMDLGVECKYASH